MIRHMITDTEFLDMVKNEQELTIPIAEVVVQSLMDKKDFEIEDYSRNNCYAESSRKKLQDIAKLFQDKSLSIAGNSNDYHNLAVSYARLHMLNGACMIIDRGLQTYQSSPDLLADKIQYCTDRGDLAAAEETFQRLENVDRSQWNWRAYSFSIDYFAECANARSGKEIEELKHIAFGVSDEFLAYAKEHKQFSDRAHHDYAKLLSVFGKRKVGELEDTEESVLIAGCNAVDAAPISALRLADIYFARGEFTEATKYLNRCFVALSKPQPGIQGSYVFLLRGMSNVSKLLADTNVDLKAHPREIEDIFRDFNTALSSNDLNDVYEKAAKTTIRILEEQSGIRNQPNIHNDEFI